MTPLTGYKIKVTFSDNKEGVVDVSDLKGKGIFSAWDDEKFFKLAAVDGDSNTVSWPGGLDLCPDVLYAEVTGQSVESVLKSTVVA